MSLYKHGTYGVIGGSVGGNVVQSGTVPVYVGCAPVHLIHDYEKYVNTPIKLSSMEDVYRYCGCSDDWHSFDLCEVFDTHFNNPAGNVGPIVVINVVDPDAQRTELEVPHTLAFEKNRSFIKSDLIILSSIVLEGYTSDQYTVSYDYEKGYVIIEMDSKLVVDTINATWDEIDLGLVEAEQVIGNVTDTGLYAGLGCVKLVYQELGLIPNLICCPRYGEVASVYEAMIKAATKINGHWDAIVYADLWMAGSPNTMVNTIDKAISKKSVESYNDERSKVFWPNAEDAQGRIRHLSVLAVWATMLTDAAHDGIPMESPSNKAVPVVSQRFPSGSASRGFDVEGANKLNAAGITTIVYWGGQWVLWGPHTAAFQHGTVEDDRVIFDTSMRLLFHVSNSFQKDWAFAIDKPMTRALADTIKAREQEKMDALAAMGAFVGKPVVEFRESSNSSGDILEGNFTWHIEGTPVSPFKSGTLNVAYTADGFKSYFSEV